MKATSYLIIYDCQKWTHMKYQNKDIQLKYYKHNKHNAESISYTKSILMYTDVL